MSLLEKVKEFLAPPIEHPGDFEAEIRRTDRQVSEVEARLESLSERVEVISRK